MAHRRKRYDFLSVDWEERFEAATPKNDPKNENELLGLCGAKQTKQFRDVLWQREIIRNKEITKN